MPSASTRIRLSATSHDVRGRGVTGITTTITTLTIRPVRPVVFA
ncbi:hypothetical protein [Xanthomonas sp. XNM01]|nr:hypothetical protein [Xanthomonas sp. XNM01]